MSVLSVTNNWNTQPTAGILLFIENKRWKGKERQNMCTNICTNLKEKKKRDSAIIVKSVNSDMGESLWSFDLN